ncbi:MULTISPECIES: hypothetical protein [unclassified Streptomyces]|uniref:hypothetical protein n=1 Tax=unclassified Streptomyces TaxID=2593676 RepID=UPI00215607E6|nr:MULTISPECIES: hypothetical protein [unclassified Streptomyces]
MGWTVLYLAFGLVALWLLGEVLLQYKARLRWRVLAFCGFLGVVLGVLIQSVAVIALGAVAFATGQSLVTLSFRKGFSTGWAIGGKPGTSRRRRAIQPMDPVAEDEYDEYGNPPPPPAPPAAPQGPDRDARDGYGDDGYARRDDDGYGTAGDDPYANGAYGDDGYPRPAHQGAPATPPGGYGQDDYPRQDAPGGDGYRQDGGYGREEYPGTPDRGYEDGGRYPERDGYPAPAQASGYGPGQGGEGYPERGDHSPYGDYRGTGEQYPGGYDDGGYGNGGPGTGDARAGGAADGSGGYSPYSDPYVGGGGYPDPTTQGYGTQYPPPGGYEGRNDGFDGGYPEQQGPWPPPGPYYQETPPGGVWVPQQRDTVMPEEYPQAQDYGQRQGRQHQQGHQQQGYNYDEQRY